jgi:hypothetical protein
MNSGLGNKQEGSQNNCLKSLPVLLGDFTYEMEGQVNTFTLCCNETVVTDKDVSPGAYESCPTVAVTSVKKAQSEVKEVQYNVTKEVEDNDLDTGDTINVGLFGLTATVAVLQII